MGWLVVLGSGRKCVVYALADGHRLGAQLGSHGKTGRVSLLDRAARHFAFSLSLLGTFLVRSGVLTSVHAFAADPERGLFILIFLALVVGGSLLLYALRAPSVASR